MKDELMVYGGMGLIFVIIIIVMFGIVGVIDNEKWNDGHCTCGGNWEYQQAVGHHVTTTYIYECDQCGKIIEINEHK